MPHLKENSIVVLKRDKKIMMFKVNKLIGSGSQADVYAVEDKEHNRFALKHLYGSYALDKPLFHEKTCVLAKYPSPHPNLCWPIHVSNLLSNNTFIYTMPLLKDYSPVTEIITRKVKLTNRQLSDLICGLIDILEALHSQNFTYGDISNSNVMYKILPNGKVDVRLIDCENVSISGRGFGLLGTGYFRSPELILKDPETGRYRSPTCKTDLYAFAVLVFRLLLQRHPLDGALTRNSRCDDNNAFVEHYAKNPLFIFDGTRNAPGEAVCKRWQKLKRPVQIYFSMMFSQDALKGRANYPDLALAKKVFKNYL